jgi:hypothetical protein
VLGLFLGRKWSFDFPERPTGLEALGTPCATGPATAMENESAAWWVAPRKSESYQEKLCISSFAPCHVSSSDSALLSTAPLLPPVAAQVCDREGPGLLPVSCRGGVSSSRCISLGADDGQGDPQCGQVHCLAPHSCSE